MSVSVGKDKSMRVRHLRVASGWWEESLRGPKAQKGNDSGRRHAARSEQSLQVVKTTYRHDVVMSHDGWSGGSNP